jgi:hypothetical protein
MAPKTVAATCVDQHGCRMQSERGQRHHVMTAVMVLGLVAGPFWGCGYRRPSRVPTGGSVQLDGSPVAGASLIFLPTGGGRPAMATSDADGNFAVSTFGGKDGLPPGAYRVAVTKLALTARAARRLERSQEQQSAPAGEGEDPPEIEFGEQDYENLLPAKYGDLETTELVVEIPMAGGPLILALTSD